MTVIVAPTLAPLCVQLSAAQVLSIVDAIADAGFDGVSTTTLHHDWAVADGLAPEEFFDHHRARGLEIRTVEVAMGWTTADRESIAEEVRPLLDMAERGGARTVIAQTLEMGRPPISSMAERLAYICDLAAERGLQVSFEFLSWSAIPDIATSVRLLDAVNRDNAGLVLDMWHWFRQPGGPDYGILRQIPAERIHVLQLTDAPTQAGDDPIVETTMNRLLPGEGDIDIEAVVDVLVENGADPIVGPEVYSAPLAELGPAEMARRAFAATEAVVGKRFLESRPVA